MPVLEKTRVAEETSLGSTEAVVSDTRSASRITSLYERYLGMPVPVVLLSLWLAGAALLGLGILTLYHLFWLSLESLAEL